MRFRTLLHVFTMSVLWAAAVAAQDDGSVSGATLPFEPGERLMYNVRVWLGLRAVGANVGTAEFTVDKVDLDGRTAYQFQVRASGGTLGYKVRSTLTSYLDAATLRSIRYMEVHEGSEKGGKLLEFTDCRISYSRWRPVKGPDGKKTKEFHWEQRMVHEIDQPFVDMLAALYLARRFDLSRRAPRQSINVCESKSLWRLRARGDKPVSLTVPAGTFEAIPIEFRSDPLNDDAREEGFRGLFGMRGSIELWMDARTRRIVRIRGIIPVGINLRVDVTLAEIIENTAG